MRVVDVLLLVAYLSGVRACSGPAVHISGVAGATRSSHYPYDGNILEAHYGDDINIFCTSNDAKNLRVEGKQNIFGKEDRSPTLPAPSGELIEVNKTTLQLSMKPGIGWFDYNCTDVETTCAAQLKVRVLPIITVVSPNVHQKSFPHSEVFHYFVPINEDFELVCYGNPELVITNGSPMETISVNETTVKSKKLRRIEYSTDVYDCQHRPSSVTTRNVEILFDHVPAATNLWCTEHHWQINCSWSVLSKDTTFTLFYTDKDGNSVRVYEDFSGSKNKKTRSCEWSLGDMHSIHGLTITGNITLVVQACNHIYCSNQTYIIDRKTIIKTGSPRLLELLRTTSHSAVVTWKGPWNSYFDKIPVEYKLTYRLPAQGLNGSSLQFTCDERAFRYSQKCEGELNLPCPGALYEVEVYVKFTSTPRTNDVYWADPARITVRTEPHNGADTVDPACLKEPETIDNKCHCLCN